MALLWTSSPGQLEVAQALVAAGANPVTHDDRARTPLMLASVNYRTDMVTFLLELPPVKASIDYIDPYFQHSALNSASYHGRYSSVQLLLDSTSAPTPGSLLAYAHPSIEPSGRTTQPSPPSSATPLPSPTASVRVWLR